MAIAAAIRTSHGLDAQIKVPNDVRIEKKKVAGVLTELAYDQEQGQPFFVLGFGVNVNCVPEDFPPELRETATSVRMAHAFSENGNPEICRASLLCDVLHHLEHIYLQLKAGETDLIMNQFEVLREDESRH